LNLETFNLAELLYDVMAKFTLALQKRSIKMSIKPEISNVLVHSDIGKLERILSNLIDNAIRHTSKNGTITIEIQDSDQAQCKVNIIDNGTGIKAEELSYIFDTRYRASNATQGPEKHTGLGLAITKKLLEILNTDIRVKSKLGEGTTFSFNLRKVIS